MSAEAVAAPESPAAQSNAPLTVDCNSRHVTRRQPFIIADKKSNAAVVIERSTANGKETGIIIKWESARDRLRDLSHVKKDLIASRMSPRIQRKFNPRREKPRWKVILKILLKNTFLLLLLYLFGKAIWREADTLRTNAVISSDSLTFESRVSELEASFKKEANNIQLQIEVVDNKMKQAEQKGAFSENELRKLTSRTDDMEKFLSEMHDSALLLMQDFELSLKELRKNKSLEVGSEGLNLDDIMIYAKEVVKKEIEKHAADGFGRVDYALASGGAEVVKHSDPYNPGNFGSWLSIVKGRNGVHANARKMLEPSFGEPGHCFPLQGNSGFVEIRLRSGIFPDAVTLEHVAKTVAHDRSSAPKDCRVSGWFEGPEAMPSNAGKRIFQLSEFVYDLEKSKAQTFKVHTAVPSVVNVIRLDFSSNHGSSSHTCIYRFRVHGYDPGSLMAMPG